jgi:hypothetical protein
MLPVFPPAELLKRSQVHSGHHQGRGERVPVRVPDISIKTARVPPSALGGPPDALDGLGEGPAPRRHARGRREARRTRWVAPAPRRRVPETVCHPGPRSPAEVTRGDGLSRAILVPAERGGRSGLNDRLRQQEKGRRHREIHCSGCPEVDGQLEARRLFDGNLRRVAPA